MVLGCLRQRKASKWSWWSAASQRHKHREACASGTVTSLLSDQKVRPEDFLEQERRKEEEEPGEQRLLKKHRRHKDHESMSYKTMAYIYDFQAVSVPDLLQEQGGDEIQMMSTIRLPGGEKVQSSLFMDTLPTSPEFRKREHERLMELMRQQNEVVAAERAKNNWRRQPPKLRKWQRAYIRAQIFKEEKRRLQEEERLETREEVDRRWQRRMQGLPESDDEGEDLPWCSQEIAKRKRRQKPKQIQPPPARSIWVTRPRDLAGSLFLKEEFEEEEEEEAGDEEAEDESNQVRGEKTEEELKAREERRLGRFYRYVEERVPRFEKPVNEDLEAPEEAEAEAEEPKQKWKQECKALVKAEYEIPPLVPGRGSILVATLHEILKDGEWNEEKVSVLSKFRYAKLLPYQVCEVLKKLTNWRVALEFFTWCKSIPLFKHDTLNYSTMIKILAGCGNHLEARKLFDEMPKNGAQPDVYTANNMMKCYGSANLVDEAMALFQQMPVLGISPDVCTFALLIDLLGKAGRYSDVRRVFSDLKARNLEADSFVYNSIIANFSRWKDLKLASEAADHMKLSGIPFSTVTYAILINMYGRNMIFFKADLLYREYLESYLAPDLYVYNNAILFMGLAGRCKEAEWVMEDIEKAGLKPDRFSYCNIISAWARLGCSADARRWFEKARRRGVTPSPEMCNALIDGYIKCVNLKAVDEILDSMPGWGVRPTLQTYTYLFNYYSECQREFVPVLRGFMRKTNHPADEFLDDIYAGRVPIGELKGYSRSFFEKMRMEKSGWASKFADAVVHYLQSYGYVREAHVVFEAGGMARLFRKNLWESTSNQWFIWLVGMEEGTALVGLKQGLLISREMLGSSQPTRVTIVTGYSTHKNTRSALAVRDALRELDSPFRPDEDVAKLVSDGLVFSAWLMGVKLELDIPFTHPGYVFAPNTEICLRFMNP